MKKRNDLKPFRSFTLRRYAGISHPASPLLYHSKAGSFNSYGNLIPALPLRIDAPRPGGCLCRLNGFLPLIGDRSGRFISDGHGGATG